MSWHTKSGQTRDVVMSGVEVEIGGTACLLGSVLDMTERKRIEESHTRLRPWSNRRPRPL